MKKILKNVQPSIRAYLGLACCYSIIDEQAFNSGWVYDKYIHLEYTSYDSQIKYADYEHYLLKVYLLNLLLNILMIFAVKLFFVIISVKCLMRASIVLRCGTKP